MPGKTLFVVALAAAPVFGQVPEPPKAAETPHPKRPAVAVIDFDYGTLQDHWWGQYDIGKGVAAQIVDLLVEDGTVRVVERSRLDTVLAEQDLAASDRANPDAAKMAKIGKVLGVRYILAGSITKFATSDKRYGGGVAGTVAKNMLGPVGGLSFHKAKQEVSLTARLIDTTTGEIVASAKGEGVAKKGQGVGFEVAAGSSAAAAGVSTQPDELRAIGMSQAQELAVTDLARAIVAQADRLSVESPLPDPTPTPTPAAVAAKTAPKLTGKVPAKATQPPKP
jgi:curli biogenesis system outer membrane secretion channel CsgG